MLIIRNALPEDLEGKAYVHYHAWNETYTGLIAQEYLDFRSLERTLASAKAHPENTLVALMDHRVVGFASYNKCRDFDCPDAGEISAIYVLRDYQGQGIGKRLLLECERRLEGHQEVVIWVLRENQNAIDFYEHLGFVQDGHTKAVGLANITTITEIRMIRKQA